MKWLIILLLLGGAGYAGWHYWNRPEEKAPEYRTAPVARGDITQAVNASGQLNPVLNVLVGSQISGMIQRLFVDFNSVVTQGQVIAELDAATYRASVSQAAGELANAKSALDLAVIDARRAKELSASKLIPEADYDKAQAQLRQAEAQVMIREALLERARVDLSRCTIYAPTNGIVISRNVDVGQTVAASLAAPTIFVIANDLTKMQIDTMVSEADIGGVEVNQSVNFTVDAFPGRNFHGRVVQIRNSPATNQNVVTYNTVVSVENRDQKLKPGMTANVAIVTAEREGALKLPNSALRFRPPESTNNRTAGAAGRAMGESAGRGSGGGRPGGGGDGTGGRRARPDRQPTRTVYVLATTNGVAVVPPKPEPRTIKTGISDGSFTEVIEGLNDGDSVIIGVMSTEATPAAGAANPFGGGGGMRRF
jgi:HlyD family secretion protein